MFRKANFTLLISFITTVSFAQSSDSIIIRKIYTEALSNGLAYGWLDHLVNNIGGRLSGSPEAEKAVLYVENELNAVNPDRIFKQDVMVPHWVRGAKETAEVRMANKKTIPVSICALGGSISTPKEGIKAKMIEVKDFDELKKFGSELIKGKIVFFNHPMDPANYNTFKSYGEAVKYRWGGASQAAKYGAVGVVVRSMTLAYDDYPHTGAMGYVDTIPKIAACAISTKGAEILSNALKAEPQLDFIYKQNCRMLPDTLSYNVIGEIKGSEYPEEIILAGGHLDSWETGKGAHDDGTGVVQCMEILNLFRKLNIHPKRTIRCIAYMNEENGGKGGEKYAELAKQNNEKNIVAIESDGGGTTPRGFSLKGDSLVSERIKQWSGLFVGYGIHEWEKGYGGADINHLENQGTFLIGLNVDSQRYFDYHHAASDTFDKVNKRELELGAASMAALMYLISEYGLR